MNATAAVLLVVTGMVAQAAEPQMLTLTCRGISTTKVGESDQFTQIGVSDLGMCIDCFSYGRQ
jgi:hypothetical protein